MKKVKSLFLLAMVFLLLPLMVAANEKVNVYLFRGQGCGYCANALAFFDSLDVETRSTFHLVDFEVWHNAANKAKMEKVAAYFNDEIKGVPYIIIGDKTYSGFKDDFKEAILNDIKTAYENKDGTYKDVVASIIPITETNNTLVTIVLILVVVGAIVFFIYMARDNKSSHQKQPAKKKTSTKGKSKK